MSAGLLILSHTGIGPVLLGTATNMLGEIPMPAKALTAARNCDLEDVYDHARELVHELDSGAGVLILTDLIGSTPSNIAGGLLAMENVRIVTGLNLSMLLRVLNYHELSLAELVEKAITGGRDGIAELE